MCWWNDPDRYRGQMNGAAALLDRQLELGNGDRTAFAYDARTFTYAQMVAESSRLANGLRRLGVVPGDRVVIQSLNDPGAIIANFAILRLGAVVVPISPLISPDDLRHVLTDCEPRAVFASAWLLEAMAAAARSCDVPPVATIGLDGTPNGDAPPSYQSVSEDEADTCESCVRDSSSVAVLFYSSGIDEPPYAMAHTLEELLVIPDNYGARCWSVGPQDVITGTAPLSVAGGYSTILTLPSRFGATSAVMPLNEAIPEKVFPFIRRHGVTALASIPTLYSRMLELSDADPSDLSTLRMVAAGGEPVTPELLAGWQRRFGLDIFEGFGTNGMMHVFISNAVARRPRPGRTGLPLAGYSVEVRDEHGSRVGAGEVGQLFVKGPVGTLYWGNPNAAAQVENRQRATTVDGWVKVGDWVTQDELGYLSFVARDTELIRRPSGVAGPLQIEEALLSHPDVQEAGVAHLSGELSALIVLTPGADQQSPTLRGELAERVGAEVGRAFVPQRMLIASGLPSTPFGTRLRRLVWEDWLTRNPVTELGSELSASV